MLENGKLINPEVRIEVTNNCNAHCVYCPREKLTRKREFMDMYSFIDVVVQAKELGAELVSLFGFGESLLHKELPEMVSFCTRNFLKTFLTTNGSLLTPDNIFALCDAGLNDIRISIHSIHPEGYRNIHRGLSWNDAMTNTFNLIAVRNKRGYPINIHITSIPEEGYNIDKIVKFWSPYNVFLEIWRPHNWGGARDYRQIKGERLSTCGRPFNGPVQVQVDGTIIPCCFLTNSELVMGDLKLDNMAYILNNEAYRRLRHQHSKNELVFPCSECDQLNDNGFSPLLWSNRDPECATGRLSTSKFRLV